MAIELTSAQEQALDEHNGFVQGDSYVLMTKKLYRHTMGIESDEELADSIRAIKQGLADIEAGRTRPFREVLAELGQTDAVSG